MLERANTVAESALERVANLRYGALAVCAVALVLVVTVVAAVASHGRSAGPSTAKMHREQTQVAQLKSQLRSSQQQLTATRAAPSQAHHSTTGTTAAHTVSHHSKKKRSKR